MGNRRSKARCRRGTLAACSQHASWNALPDCAKAGWHGLRQAPAGRDRRDAAGPVLPASALGACCACRQAQQRARQARAAPPAAAAAAAPAAARECVWGARPGGHEARCRVVRAGSASPAAARRPVLVLAAARLECVTLAVRTHWHRLAGAACSMARQRAWVAVPPAAAAMHRLSGLPPAPPATRGDAAAAAAQSRPPSPEVLVSLVEHPGGDSLRRRAGEGRHW